LTELQKRVITGAILIPIVIFSLILGRFYFLALIIVFMTGGIVEFLKIRSELHFAKLLPLALLVFLPFLIMITVTDVPIVYSVLYAVFVPWVLFPFYYSRGVGIGLYFSLFFEIILLSLAGFSIFKARQFGFWVSVYFFVTIWYFDSACYFVGRKWGKRQLAPLVSPKKTWEGFVGGLILLIPYVFLVKFIGLPGLDDLTFLLVSAYVVSIMGQQGDLAESAIKREAGVKDSSNLFPGHGGILDRTDSLVAAAPFYFVILNWLWK